MANILEPVKKC